MKNVNLESQLYKLHELKAELDRGNEQYQKALPQYQALLDIVEKSGKLDKLPENFIETLRDDMKNIKRGLTNINKRQIYIQMLLDKVKDNPEVEGIITLTLLSLGIGLDTEEAPKE